MRGKKKEKKKCVDLRREEKRVCKKGLATQSLFIFLRTLVSYPFLYIYIYIYMCVCVCVCVLICIYIYIYI